LLDAVKASIDPTRNTVKQAAAPPTIKHFESPLLSRDKAAFVAQLCGFYHSSVVEGFGGVATAWDLGIVLILASACLQLATKVGCGLGAGIGACKRGNHGSLGVCVWVRGVQTYYEAIGVKRPAAPQEVQDAQAAMGAAPLSAAWNLWSLQQHIQLYAQVRKGSRACETLCVAREEPRGTCSRRVPRNALHPPPPTPQLQHHDTLSQHYCTLRQSRIRAYAERKRTSVLDQLVSILTKDLEEQWDQGELHRRVDAVVEHLRTKVGDGGVLVVGGGFLGQKARAGSRHTPVVQLVLKKLAQYFRIVVVDEVRAGGGVGGVGVCVRTCV
jgi:hypothetical protein